MEKGQDQANAALPVSSDIGSDPDVKKLLLQQGLGSYKRRIYRDRVPLKPDPPVSASAAATTTEAEKSHEAPQPPTEQKELVRQVQSGTIISILWRHGRRMGYDDEGKIIYYSGADEYYRAKVMQWKQSTTMDIARTKWH